MLNDDDIMIIRSKLRCLWKDVMQTPEAVKIWQNSFKPYDMKTIEAAVDHYMAVNKFRPNPADIIACIPANYAKPEQGQQPRKFVPKFERLPDGRYVRIIQCRRCNDLGLIMREDEEGRIYGRPCVCEAALAKYGAAAAGMASRTG